MCCSLAVSLLLQTYGPLDEASLALVAFEVLKIVKACHDMGILHGDVKPANFCLTWVMQACVYAHATTHPWPHMLDYHAT